MEDSTDDGRITVEPAPDDLRFGIMPDWVLLHPDLSAQAVRVYGALVRFSTMPKGAIPSHRTLATQTHSSISTVRRSIGELVEAGAIQIEQRMQDGRQTTNRYLVRSTPVHPRAGGVSTREQPPLSTREQGKNETEKDRHRGERTSEVASVENPVEDVDTGTAGVDDPVDEPSSEVAEALWGEATRLCDLLADTIVDTGDPTTKRPNVTKRWVTEMERLLRIDGKQPDHVERAIRWAHQHPFWSSNVLSPQSLRKHWEKMARQAARDQQSASQPGRTPTGLDAVRAYHDRSRGQEAG